MSDTALIHCTVVDVQPARRGRLLALACVEIDIEGVAVTLEGVQVHLFRSQGSPKDMVGVRAPQYRAADGSWRDAIHLPGELEKVLGDVVLAECRQRGLLNA